MGRSLILISVIFCVLSCTEKQENGITGYNLNHPSAAYDLPGILKEISGLDYQFELLAVQDEKGIIFKLDPTSGQILEELKFAGEGDYEGVASTGTAHFVLESNGDIFSFTDGISRKIGSFDDSKGFDFEGLSVTPDGLSLLIACKEHGKKKKNNLLHVFRFDLLTLTYDEKPYFSILKEEINPKFSPSAIAFHPTGDYYILSARTATILVVSAAGEVKEHQELNSFIFRQAEGITFGPSGEMYVANEQNGGPPTLLRFDPVYEKN